MLHFDILPGHPKPLRQESMTGYIIRLGQANGIDSIDAVATLLFPNQDHRITRSLLDFPPLYMGTFSQASYCSTDILLQTTFYHLGRKFSCSTHPQALSRFLSGKLAKTLRYCPDCIREKGYHSLRWRFLALEGCPEHGCKLMDQCLHCGASIPLFASPLQIGVCGNCHANFGEFVAPKLNEVEMSSCRLHSDELEFLLTPHACEHNPHIMRSVGIQLAEARKTNQLTIAQFSELTQFTRNTIIGIERGTSMTNGSSFLSYFQYAHSMETDLKHLFLNADRFPYTEGKANYQERDITLQRKVKEAIRVLKNNNKRITQENVAELIGVSAVTLWKHRGACELIQHEKLVERQKQEDKLADELLIALVDMQANKITVSQRNAAQALKIKRYILRSSPRLMAIVNSFKI